MPRPRGARLIEGFSQSLDDDFSDSTTQLSAFGLASKQTQVLALCERPARLGLTNADPVIDFWVKQSGGEIPVGSTR